MFTKSTKYQNFMLKKMLVSLALASYRQVKLKPKKGCISYILALLLGQGV